MTPKMARVVDLLQYRIKGAEVRGFGPWRKRFHESYDARTRLEDLSEKTLYLLAQPGEESALAFYELIMGILNLGTAPKFYYMEKTAQMKVLDVHLFLADQVRFELMRRLGWIESFPCRHMSLLDIVQRFEAVRDHSKGKAPELAPSHPQYEQYTNLDPKDREVLVRRMLPGALDSFKERLRS